MKTITIATVLLLSSCSSPEQNQLLSNSIDRGFFILDKLITAQNQPTPPPPPVTATK